MIHNAAKVGPDSPRYGEARQVAQMAIQGLQDLADSASQKDIKDISPGKLGTAAVPTSATAPPFMNALLVIAIITPNSLEAV